MPTCFQLLPAIFTVINTSPTTNANGCIPQRTNVVSSMNEISRHLSVTYFFLFPGKRRGDSATSELVTNEMQRDRTVVARAVLVQIHSMP